MPTNTVLAKMAVLIDAQNAEFNKKLAQTRSALTGFTSGLSKVAGVIAAAFAVKQIASFALEVSRLAGEADGVQAAFDKLPNSTELMRSLKEATGETVSELDLMKRTVQASNFGISLQALPKLLEFAAVRAQQTGQSVDYLVDSIVTGIGRKSPLILDNLGISAVALKEKLGGVSIAAADVGQVAEAVGQIASDELKNMGSLADTNSARMQRLSAVWDDFSVAIGRALNGTGILGTSLEFIIDRLRDIKEFSDFLNSDPVFDSFNKQTKEAVDNFRTLNKELQAKSINELAQDVQKAKRDLEQFQTFLSSFDEALANGLNFEESIDFAGLQSGFKLTAEEANKFLNNHEFELELLQKGYDSLKDQFNQFMQIYNSAGESVKTVGLIAELNEQIKTIKDEINDATSVGEIRKLQNELSGLESRLEFLTGGPLKIPIEIDLEDSFSEDAKQNIIDRLESLPFEGIVVPVELEFDRESTDAFDAAIDNIALKLEENKQRIESNFLAITDIVGSSIAAAVEGERSFAEALGNITFEIIDMYLKQALAAAIAKSIQSGGPLPVGLALAAVGVSAVKAMFRKAVGGRGGSGGGSVGSSFVRQENIRQADRQTYDVAQTVIRGQDLYVIFQKTSLNNQQTRFNG